jgi:hypothetical protein
MGVTVKNLLRMISYGGELTLINITNLSCEHADSHLANLDTDFKIFIGISWATSNWMLLIEPQRLHSFLTVEYT